jgi:tetratricopeptide (TPR) repeat protein
MAQPGAKSCAVAIIVLILLAHVIVISKAAAKNRAESQICDVAADFALGREDYATAVVLHCRLLQSQPGNALAHYHLGFAYGMMGDTPQELTEYLTSARLGLKRWDLFLNLGLANLGQHDLARATEALETAVALGPEHFETHFNLALVYESDNRLSEALREINAARQLAPEDLDVANTNATICVELCDTVQAHRIWTHLVKVAPNYAPARANLQILNRSFALNDRVEPHCQLSYSKTGAGPAGRIRDGTNLQTVAASSFK